MEILTQKIMNHNDGERESRRSMDCSEKLRQIGEGTNGITIGVHSANHKDQPNSLGNNDIPSKHEDLAIRRWKEHGDSKLETIVANIP
ncbi:hypothetical protein C5167_029583 [Papaver somniferum]|nr:hypothetical protein C5167_029583 [Papaver somniferum]